MTYNDPNSKLQEIETMRLSFPTRRQSLHILVGAVAFGMCPISVNTKAPPLSVNEVKTLLQNKGYEILDDKVGDSQSSNYIIILPEMHQLTSPYAANALDDLVNINAINRIGIENCIGKAGQNVLKSTQQHLVQRSETDVREKGEIDLSGWSDGGWIDEFYGRFLRQESIPTYGLETEPTWQRVHVSEGSIVKTMVLVLPDELRDEAYTKNVERLKKRLDYLKIPYNLDVFTDLQKGNEFAGYLLKKFYDMRIFDRNDEFLKKIDQKDAIVVGVAHAQDLKIRYNSNVLVLNPVSEGKSKELMQKTTDAYQTAPSKRKIFTNP